MGGGDGRRPLEAMPPGSSERGLFKAVYMGSFGKHNAGVVVNYALKRASRKDVTSSARFSEGIGAASTGTVLRQKGEVRGARGREHKGRCRDVSTQNPLSLGPAEPGFSSGDAQAEPEEWSLQSGRKSATRGGQRRAGRLSLVSNGARGQLSASPVITRPIPGARSEHSQQDSGRKDGRHSKARDQCNSGRLKSQERHGIKVKICKQKVKSHCAVLKVITKMLEENEQLRGRLLQCSQKSSEASPQTESVFGWM